jgi:hypothetical protein
VRDSRLKLSLNFGIGCYPIFNGRLFIPKGNELTYSVGITNDSDSNQSQPVIRDTPPIMPYWLDPTEAFEKINIWLDSISGPELEDWVDSYTDENWLKEVLKALCRFTLDRGASPEEQNTATDVRSLVKTILQKALKLLIIEFAMGHQIHVPDNAKDFQGATVFSEGTDCLATND